jgi:GNAT superfamily N-acetyltransferase
MTTDHLPPRQAPRMQERTPIPVEPNPHGASATMPARTSAGPREITLRSGDRVLVRPIRSYDDKRLLDGFERLSPDSRYRRFFAATPRLASAQVRYLTGVDHHAHEAMVAIDPGTGDGLGVARFIRSREDPTVAEVAVAVVDEWHGRGLGTALLHELATRAREEGVVRFSAHVLAENTPMLDVLKAFGDAKVTHRDRGVVELMMDVPPEGVPETLSHTVRAAARGDLRLEARHPATAD